MQDSVVYQKFVNFLRERGHCSVHVQFHKPFIQNKFGYAYKICDRLWFAGDLKNLIDDIVEFVRTFLQNVFTSAVWF